MIFGALTTIMLLAVASRGSCFFYRGTTGTSVRVLSMSKIFIDVPFQRKDDVKALGARWDKDMKKWYIPDGVDPALFAEFGAPAAPAPAPPPAPPTPSGPVFLEVPFASKDEVKSLGARWNKEMSKWYVPEGVDPTPFSAWIPANAATSSAATAASGSSANFAATKQYKKPWNKPAFTSTTTTTPAPSTFNKAGYTAVKSAVAPTWGKPAPKDSVLILGLATNGLPVQTRGYPSYDDLKSYDPSRIVQVAYSLCAMKDFQQVDKGSFIVKSDGFPIDNTEFHGITLDMSLSQGIPFPEAAEKIFEALTNADHVLSHSADFVHSIFRSELFRHAMMDKIEAFEKKRRWCSMQLTRDLLVLPDARGQPKNPSLPDLVAVTSNQSLPKQRGADVNVEFLRKAMSTLIATNRLTTPFQAK